jgi:uncharacterized membrane protein YkvA (DUF1232 family)
MNSATVWAMKWLGVILLAIVGVVAAIVAVEYLVVPIHSLPSFIPGGHSGNHYHKVNGHYNKRGAVAAVIAIAAFVAAGYWAYRLRRPKVAAPVAVAAPQSAAQALSVQPSTTEDGSNVEGSP